MDKLDDMFLPVSIAVIGASSQKGKNVVLRMAPMGRDVVRRMVKAIKGYPILTLAPSLIPLE